MFKFDIRFFNKKLGKSQRYAAFTIAEVLITLGVIGIVAAMTIPTLNQMIQIQQLESRFKKSYSSFMTITNDLQLNKGFKNWEIEYCSNTAECIASNGGIGTREKLKLDLEPYLRGAKYTQNRSSNPQDKRVITGINKEQNPVYNLYRNAETFQLADGSVIDVFRYGNTFTTMSLDTNGFKGPNRIGYDIFPFRLQGPKIIPGVAYPPLSTCTCNLEDGYEGRGCATYAMTNVCPWDSSKKYWEKGCLPNF